MWERNKKTKKDVLVFLDVDGVLNTTNSRISMYEVRDENVSALGMLRNVLEKKGFATKIVLSSTWRLGYDKSIEQCSPQIQKLISKLAGVDISIYDKTPIYKEHTRDVEINHYNRRYELKNKDFTYIILDDDTSVFNETILKNMNFYKVNERTGLIISDVDKITKMIK